MAMQNCMAPVHLLFYYANKVNLTKNVQSFFLLLLIFFCLNNKLPKNKSGNKQELFSVSFYGFLKITSLSKLHVINSIVFLRAGCQNPLGSPVLSSPL